MVKFFLIHRNKGSLPERPINTPLSLALLYNLHRCYYNIAGDVCMEKNCKISQNVRINQTNNKLSFILFFTLFAFLAFQVTRPIMMAVIWSAMLSFTTAPIFKKLNRLTGFRYPSIAAGLTMLLLALGLIIPLLAVLSSLAGEVADLTAAVTAFMSRIELGQIRDITEILPSWLPDWLSDSIISFSKDSDSVKAVVSQAAKWSGTFLSAFSKSMLHGASAFLFEVMVIMMVSFFFIRDGEKIVNYIKSVIPLSENEGQNFFRRAESLLHSVIFGILLIVAIQAVLGSLGWWFVGLGNPAFFGMLMFFFGMFPAGTAVVWIPGGLYLLLTGDIKNGAILLLWGTAIVGTVDNLLRPILISGGKEGEEIPTLLIIMGLFGGVISWGFLGIFLGPLVLVLFTLVFDIYRSRLLAAKAERAE